jgi:predicted AAA+ superfamily ATPase
VVLLKDSVRDSEEDFLTDAIFEDDGIKKAHIEKDFIAFCSSTPGKQFLYRSLFSLLLLERRTLYIALCIT